MVIRIFFCSGTHVENSAGVLASNLSYECVLTFHLTDVEQVAAGSEETMFLYYLEHLGLNTLHLFLIWGI